MHGFPSFHLPLIMCIIRLIVLLLLLSFLLLFLCLLFISLIFFFLPSLFVGQPRVQTHLVSALSENPPGLLIVTS